MTQQPENFRAILAENIYGAAEATEFRFDLLKSRGHRMLHRIQPQMDLFNVATNGGNCGLKSALRHHFGTDGSHIITQLLHAAGDKANQIVIRLCQ